MRLIYFLFGIGWLYNQIIHFPERLEFISHLNYLTMALIGVGAFILKRIVQVYIYGQEPTVFSEDFTAKLIVTVGIVFGLPLLL